MTPTPIFAIFANFCFSERAQLIGLCNKGIQILILFLLLSVIAAHAGNNSNWVIKKIGGNAVIGTAEWCGSDSKIVWQGVTSGIHLADLSSNLIKKITNSWQHTTPFCSLDGQFVFFMDESTNKRKVIDLKTSKTTTIECLNRNVFLSPSMDAAVSFDAKGCESIDLPWGEVLPVKKITGMRNQEGGLSSVVTWLSDKKKIVLTFITPFKPGGFSQRISAAVYDLENAKLMALQLTDNPHHIRVTKDGKYLFYLGYPPHMLSSGSPNNMHLFRGDIERTANKNKNIQLNVSGFDLSPQNNIAILKNNGDILISPVNGGELKLVSSQKQSTSLKFSPSGLKLLLMKQDPFHAREGPEGPPITNSVYVLNVN